MNIASLIFNLTGKPLPVAALGEEPATSAGPMIAPMVAANDPGTAKVTGIVPGGHPEKAAAAIAPDALAEWLCRDSLCLILRDGKLTFTGTNGQGTGEPSAALRQHVEQHQAALVDLLTPA